MKRVAILRALFLCLLVLTYGAGHLSGQTYSYAHYDVKDGLAGSTVYRMVQDKEGFIWFATETGLSRFDGTRFKNFTTRDGLPDNEIINLFADSRNRIWIMPFDSRIAYFWKGRIYDQQNDPVLAKVKMSGTLVAVIEDTAGNIVIQQNDCLSIIHTDGTVTNKNIAQFDRSDVFGIVKVGLNDKSGFSVMNVTAHHKMYLADLNGDKLNVISKDYLLPDISNALCSWLDPKLAIYARGGVGNRRDSLIFIDPRTTNVLFGIQLPEGFIGISHLDDSTFTLNTFKYTYLFDMRQRKITDSFLKGQTVNGVIRDSEGNLWFSTLGKGVYRLGSRDIGNYTFTSNSNNLAVTAIAGFDSTLYVGGDNFHLWTIDGRSGTVRDIRIDNDRTRGRIMAIIRLRNKELIIGSDRGGYKVRGTEYKPQKLYMPEAIKSLSLIQDSIMMVCTNAGIWTYAVSSGRLIDTIWHKRVTCALLKDCIYYVGTLYGLLAVKTRNDFSFMGNQDTAFANRITALGNTPDGVLWVATDGYGLVGYKEGKVIARLTRDQGLTSNICRNIFVKGNDIWVGTDRGLNKITSSPEGYTIIPYTIADGLNSGIINAVYVRGNDVFVGTPEGLSFFNERKLSNISECRLHIMGITVSDRAWPPDSSKFNIPHQNNNIQFDFVGISFKSAGNITYKYRLIGLDNKWKTTDQTSVSYPSLPSGTYEFQIQAFNKFGVPSALIHIDFAIERSLWERGWFRICILLLLAGLIGWSFNRRVKRIMRKEAEKAETVARMTELEQMALRSQMNPHFIFNCLNSIQDYVMNRDVLGVNEFITNFSRLIRLTLELSIQSRISLSEEVNYLSTYLDLEKRRFEDKFVYEITLSEQIDAEDYHIPPLILQPYVENAIRHGINYRKDKEGKIRINVGSGADHLICSIEDNGVGRKQSARLKGDYSIEYQSRGMALTAKRVEMFNKTNRSFLLIEIQDLEDISGTPTGTRIILRFPFSDIKG